MKAKDIRNMTSQEIVKKIDELKEELFNLRFQGATSSIENPKRFRTVRKDIARMKTILREEAIRLKKESKK